MKKMAKKIEDFTQIKKYVIICNKTKNYQIQKRYLLLFIFLHQSDRLWSFGSELLTYLYLYHNSFIIPSFLLSNSYLFEGSWFKTKSITLLDCALLLHHLLRIHL